MPPHIATHPATGSCFHLIQSLVDQWEGGFSDHPQDPGGLTNRGVTQATLSRWLGRPATRQDVRALTKAEVWGIMKSCYFDKIRGDALPPPVAAMAHNAAVLSGPARSAAFLQEALARQGFAVKRDGHVGPETLAAAAKAAPRQLAAAFADVQEAYLRSLHHFPVFGKGWLRRLAAFRQLAKIIPLAAAADAAPHRPDETRAAVPLHGLAGTAIPLDSGGIGAQSFAARNPARPTLGPVNAALGMTLGHLLDGRKTAFGIIGAMLTALASPGNAMPTGEAFQLARPALVQILTILEPLVAASPFLQPVFLALTAWGVLGKLEKWSRDAS